MENNTSKDTDVLFPASGKNSSDGKIINREYQDSVFRDLFKDKSNFLQLYKTIHPEDTAVSEADLEQITIENVLAFGLYNDIAYLAGNTLMLFFEHQSTIDNNIPLYNVPYKVDTARKRDYLKC